MRRLFPFLLIMITLAGCIWARDTETERRNALRQLVVRAESGDPKSIFELARLHDTGYDTIEKDTLRSNALYLLAAQKGYGPARNFIGFRYFNGEGLRKDIDSALFWIRLAASDGDLTAASNLGYLLWQSDDIPHDYNEARKWLSIAAEALIPSALSQLGDFNRLGLGEAPDTMEAISLYEKASQAGVVDAQLKLMDMMSQKWQTLSPDSALSLGVKYYTYGVPFAAVDLLETEKLSENPKAMAILGDAYSKGYGVNYDHQKSIDYFYKAAMAGNPSAQYIVAELLDIFPDAIDTFSAAYWYDKAAQSGITDSETAYSRLFAYP